MIVIAKELLQYEKDNIKYCINIPKLYNGQKVSEDFINNKMIDEINRIILEDITTFMYVVEESHNILNQEQIFINSLTEFQVGYISKDIMSLGIEFSQLVSFCDISYLKGYNYDFRLRREIKLKDLFKKDVNFENILKKDINDIMKKYFHELRLYGDELEDDMTKNIYLDEENTFYFTDEYLILPFSSCEVSENILNLIEFKISFNKIYPYLNEYAIKNIVKKIIL